MKKSSGLGLARSRQKRKRWRRQGPTKNGRRARPDPTQKGGAAGQAHPRREEEGQARPKSKGRVKRDPTAEGMLGRLIIINNHVTKLEFCGACPSHSWVGVGPSFLGSSFVWL